MMTSVVEMLAAKKKPATAAPITVLPMLQREHDGSCGEGCGCGESADEGGCCGG
mgnify:CR=1 FL=1